MVAELRKHVHQNGLNTKSVLGKGLVGIYVNLRTRPRSSQHK
jgi:hypothetical protein